MKNLICAALVAGSMVAMAEDDTKTDAAPAVAAEAAKARPQRRQMSPEQRQKMREMAEKRRAEFMAKKEAQVLEIVKKYVPEEEKAKALVKELQDVVMAGRRSMTRRPPRPSAAKPAEVR